MRRRTIGLIANGTQATMKKPNRQIQIKGFKRELSKNRQVFVGHLPNNKTYYIRFKNENGEHTRLKLSPEAFAALIEMKGVCDRGGDPVWQFKHKEGQWDRI